MKRLAHVRSLRRHIFPLAPTLGQNMENLDPFSTAQKKEDDAFWRSRNLRIQPSLLSPEGRAARSDICIRRLAFVRFHGGGGSAVSFYSVQDCSAALSSTRYTPRLTDPDCKSMKT